MLSFIGRSMNEIKRWLFNVEDENGDTHYLIEDEFIGTYDEACARAGTLADEWEQATGTSVARIELERRGPVTRVIIPFGSVMA